MDADVRKMRKGTGVPGKGEALVKMTQMGDLNGTVTEVSRALTTKTSLRMGMMANAEELIAKETGLSRKDQEVARVDTSSHGSKTMHNKNPET